MDTGNLAVPAARAAGVTSSCHSAQPPSGWRAASVPAVTNPWILGARPRTLPAAVVPVAVGASVAVGVGAPVAGWRGAVALVVSLALQVGVNYANDYSDGVRGTDDVRVGPQRLVASGLRSPSAVRTAAFVAFGVAGLGGLLLAATTTWWLLAVGVACFAAGWGYTGGPAPYGYLGLGELFVFTFFGLVATAGTTFVMIERLTLLSVGAAVPVGLLATALLVVNNLRDIPTDTVAGKRTLAVRLGDRGTRRLYLLLLVGAFVAVPFVAGLGLRPVAAIALLAVIPARRPLLTVLGGATGPALIPVLGATGRVQLLFGGLFAIGLAASVLVVDRL
jgi:1,4-dihydroxy-2-naphthoate octaprenyltransferase